VTTNEDVVARMGILNAHIARKWVIPKRTIIPCIVLQKKVAHMSKYENLESKRLLKSPRIFEVQVWEIHQSWSILLMSSVSTACNFSICGRSKSTDS